MGKGEPVIILHGLFGMLDNWQSFARSLSQYYAVYILDLRNHGRSPHSNEHSYDTMAQDIIEFYKEHQLRKIKLIGHSMGGKVAMCLAQTHSELLDKLVIIDVSPAQSRTNSTEVINTLKAVNLNKITSRTEADEILAKNLQSDIVRQWLLKSLYRDKLNQFNWRFNLDVISNNVEGIAAAVTKHKYTKSTLFIKGELSQHIQDSDIDVIREYFTQCYLQNIPGSGHWVHYDKPGLLLQAILLFFKTNKRERNKFLL